MGISEPIGIRFRRWLCAKLGDRRDVLIREDPPKEVGPVPSTWVKVWACTRCDRVFCETYTETYTEWLVRLGRDPAMALEALGPVQRLLFGLSPAVPPPEK